MDSFVQELFTSRGNYGDGTTRVGQKGRIWYDSVTNAFRVGDGVTPGGIVISGGGGYFDGIGATGSFDFNIAADDSTQRTVNAGETVQFLGSRGISTSSNADGVITITGPDLSVYALSSALASYALSSAIPTNNNQLINGAAYITASALTGLATETYVTTRGYITSSALTGLATETYVTTRGYITSSALSTYALTSSVPTDISQLTDLQGLLGSGGGGGGTTYITNTTENPFTFSVAGDDSTLREISNGESIKFTGAGGIAVTTDAEGNITVTGTPTDLTGYATETYVTNQGYITSSALTGLATETFVTTQGYITSSALTGLATETFVTTQGYITGLSWNDLTDKPSLAGTYTFNVAADDSTLREISSDETVKFIGAGGVTTSSDSEGAITITGPSLAGLATETYVTTRGYLTTVSYADVTDKPTLFSGSYTDLTNQPAIPSIGNLTFTGNVVDSQDSSEISFTPSVSFDSNVTVGGDLLPNTNLGGNLGSLEQQWKSLYVSASTIFIGNTSISAKEDGLQVGDANLATETFVEQRVSTAVSELLNGASTAYDTLKELEQFLLDGDTVVAGIISSLATKANISDLVLTIAGDDSTEKTISIGEGIRLQGTGNITITTDQEGKVTINGAAPDLSAYALTENIPTAVSDLTNDTGFITSPINANGTFSLPTLTAEPASPQAGQMALANGTSWDPISQGSGTPYLVIYTGTGWLGLGVTVDKVYEMILEMG